MTVEGYLGNIWRSHVDKLPSEMRVASGMVVRLGQAFHCDLKWSGCRRNYAWAACIIPVDQTSVIFASMSAGIRSSRCAARNVSVIASSIRDKMFLGSWTPRISRPKRVNPPVVGYVRVCPLPAKSFKAIALASRSSPPCNLA